MTGIVVKSSDLDTLLIIECPVSDAAIDGAGSGLWGYFDEEFASVRDVLPSRGETLTNGQTTAIWRARVRMYYRDDITPAMRFVHDGRIMQIISGPAELGRQGGLEFMVEEYRPAGNSA